MCCIWALAALTCCMQPCPKLAPRPTWLLLFGLLLLRLLAGASACRLGCGLVGTGCWLRLCSRLRRLLLGLLRLLGLVAAPLAATRRLSGLQGA